MIYRLDPDYPGFPDPGEAEPEGLIAVGGDLEPLRLINAYACGIFPWFSDDDPIMWWSLDPRMVLFLDEFRYSKSLQRVVRSGKFEVRIDSQFELTMRSCAHVDRTAQGQTGTWITEEMVQAYVRLHELGFAHSFETYCEGKLVGGLYGVSLGPFFFGESMFSLVANASKLALIYLAKYMQQNGGILIDVQFETPHLRSMGGRHITYEQYMELITKG